jgi:hypothetical protein
MRRYSTWPAYVDMLMCVLVVIITMVSTKRVDCSRVRSGRQDIIGGKSASLMATASGSTICRDVSVRSRRVPSSTLYQRYTEVSVSQTNVMRDSTFVEWSLWLSLRYVVAILPRRVLSSGNRLDHWFARFMASARRALSRSGHAIRKICHRSNGEFRRGNAIPEPIG